MRRRPYVSNADELKGSLTRLCSDDPWLSFALGCLERVLARPDPEVEECLLHHDLHGDNVVVSRDRTRIEGVIDFGAACIGDVQRDFVAMCWHGFDAMHQLVESYHSRTGRRLDRTCIKDYFCVTNIRDVIQFRSRSLVPVESKMLAGSEQRLTDWALQDQDGAW